ncbi:MAG: PAS domain S-box protein [Candidatus Omnitrophota bacterium]
MPKKTNLDRKMKQRVGSLKNGCKDTGEGLEKERIIGSIIQGSAVATFVVDLGHKIVSWNAACEELTGIKSKGLIGTSDHWKAFYKDRRPCLADLVIDNKTRGLDKLYAVYAKSVLVPDGLRAEGWHHNLGGKSRYIIFDAAPIYGPAGRMIAAIETIQDLTELKATEEALRQDEIKLRAIFDQSFQFIGLLTIDGILIEVNRSALELNDIKASSVLGKPFWETPWWTHSPELQDKLRQAVKSVARGGFVRFEATHPAKDGTLHFVDFSLKPVKDGSGKVIFLIPEGRDITERKQAEAEIKKAYDSLKEAQSRLIQAEKMETVGRLASGVAHEVKNPLAIISQGIDCLSRDVESHSKNVSLTLSYMRGAVHSADRVIKGLLDFAALSTVEFEPVNLNSAIEQAVLLVNNSLGQNKIELIEDLDKNTPPVNLDKNKIEQVFVNLLMNAIDAMPAGGRLKIVAYAKKLTGVDIGAGNNKEDVFKPGRKAVIVKIEDTGCGILEGILPKVYEPFFTTKRAKGGTGLGLFIVKAIMDLHKGIIRIENKQDKNGVRVVLIFKL